MKTMAMHHQAVTIPADHIALGTRSDRALLLPPVGVPELVEPIEFVYPEDEMTLIVANAFDADPRHIIKSDDLADELLLDAMTDELERTRFRLWHMTHAHGDFQRAHYTIDVLATFYGHGTFVEYTVDQIAAMASINPQVVWDVAEDMAGCEMTQDGFTVTRRPDEGERTGPAAIADVIPIRRREQ